MIFDDVPTRGVIQVEMLHQCYTIMTMNIQKMIWTIIQISDSARVGFKTKTTTIATKDASVSSSFKQSMIREYLHATIDPRNFTSNCLRPKNI